MRNLKIITVTFSIFLALVSFTPAQTPGLFEAQERAAQANKSLGRTDIASVLILRCEDADAYAARHTEDKQQADQILRTKPYASRCTGANPKSGRNNPPLNSHQPTWAEWERIRGDRQIADVQTRNKRDREIRTNDRIRRTAEDITRGAPRIVRIIVFEGGGYIYDKQRDKSDEEYVAQSVENRVAEAETYESLFWETHKQVGIAVFIFNDKTRFSAYIEFYMLKFTRLNEREFHDGTKWVKCGCLDQIVWIENQMFDALVEKFRASGRSSTN